MVPTDERTSPAADKHFVSLQLLDDGNNYGKW